jgi:hypothetical protein
LGLAAAAIWLVAVSSSAVINAMTGANKRFIGTSWVSVVHTLYVGNVTKCARNDTRSITDVELVLH